MIDKSSYQAPEGLPQDPDFELELAVEGEVEDDAGPLVVELDDGGVEVTLDPADDMDPMIDAPFDANLAEYLDDSELHLMASDLIEKFDADVMSRKDWAETYVKGLEVLGLKYEERTEPWDGACGVYSSILSEAAIRFSSETMSETFPAAGPVKTKVLGASTREKEKAAERVREDMNYQLTEVMTEYRPEHERMLYSLGLAGSAFKKVYDDPIKDRQTSVFIPAEDMIVPYGASTIEDAERVTHMMRKTAHEVESLQASGFYRECDLGDPRSFPTDIEQRKAEEGGYSITDDERFTLLEIHTFTRVPGVDSDDELAKPYVITVEKSNNTVLSIRRNWREEDPRSAKRQHFVHYTYVPGFGLYGLGLIHIVGGYARAGTSIIRQLVDAGSLANLSGGLKARGLRIKGDDTPIAPGEFRDVDVPSGSIRDNIMPLPYKEPSQTLLALLGRITDEGRRLAAISDMNISDMGSNAPVGTTLALLERVLKPMAAVQARVHFAMKAEFKLLKEIISDRAPETYEYDPEGAAPRARQQDYATTAIIPVSDPNSSTLAQRIAQYQAVQQLSTSAPQIYDLPYLHRQMIEVLGVKNADKIVPTSDDQKPRDPVSENMSFLTGKPTKAFIYQDHDAHIAAHMSFMQDPAIAGAIGQSPMAMQMQAAIMAHVAEHLAFGYRSKLEQQLGADLPAPDAPLPEEMEVQLSRLVARAGVQLTNINKQQAAQAQAQQMAQDPMVQMQQKELALKEGDLQRKAQKDQSDAALKAEKIRVDAELKERQQLIDAQRAGVMGRSADAAILAQDREAALKMAEFIRADNQTNTLGVPPGAVQ